MADVVTTEGRARPAELDEQATSDRPRFTQAEVQAMLEASPDPWDKAAIVLVCGAGLHISELTNLTWDDAIDDAENPIKLRVTGSNSQTRQVLVERRLWHKYVAPLFFASMEGGAAGCTSTTAQPRIFPVIQQTIQHTIEQALARAGIEKKPFSVH